MRGNTSPIYAYAGCLTRAMLGDLDITREAEYAAALEATNGVLLKADSGTPLSHQMWFIRASDTQMQKHGSPELVEHLAAHPRTKRDDFERQWLETYLNGEEL